MNRWRNASAILVAGAAAAATLTIRDAGDAAAQTPTARSSAALLSPAEAVNAACSRLRMAYVDAELQHPDKAATRLPDSVAKPWDQVVQAHDGTGMTPREAIDRLGRGHSEQLELIKSNLPAVTATLGMLEKFTADGGSAAIFPRDTRWVSFWQEHGNVGVLIAVGSETLLDGDRLSDEERANLIWSNMLLPSMDSFVAFNDPQHPELKGRAMAVCYRVRRTVGDGKKLIEPEVACAVWNEGDFRAFARAEISRWEFKTHSQLYISRHGMAYAEKLAPQTQTVRH